MENVNQNLVDENADLKQENDTLKNDNDILIDQVADLTERLNTRKDVSIKILSSKLKYATAQISNGYDEISNLKEKLKNATTTGALTVVKPPSRFPITEIPRLRYPKQLDTIGFAEVVFTAYVDATRMKIGSVEEYTHNGRVTDSFFTKCFTAIQPEEDWFRKHFDHNEPSFDPINYFFWKIETLRLKTSLVTLIGSYENYNLTTRRTHIITSQLSLLEKVYKDQRTQFIVSCEHREADLSRDYSTVPPITEYTKAVPVSNVSLFNPAALKRKRVEEFLSAPKNVLVDITPDGENVYGSVTDANK